MATPREHAEEASAARRVGARSVLIAALVLTGCGNPHAWNQYVHPNYPTEPGPLAPLSTIPAEIMGSVDGVPSDTLRSVVADATDAPRTFYANAANAAQEGSSTPPEAVQEGSSMPGEAGDRTVWTFTRDPASGGAGTRVHLQAQYYSDGKVLSVAEGDTTVDGASDPRLRQLAASVASKLFPPMTYGRGSLR